ncbi:hypothetical protein B0H13DRAFT_2541385, partial [Mycena leptocephala]
ILTPTTIHLPCSLPFPARRPERGGAGPRFCHIYSHTTHPLLVCVMSSVPSIFSLSLFFCSYSSSTRSRSFLSLRLFCRTGAGAAVHPRPPVSALKCPSVPVGVSSSIFSLSPHLPFRLPTCYVFRVFRNSGNPPISPRPAEFHLLRQGEPVPVPVAASLRLPDAHTASDVSVLFRILTQRTEEVDDTACRRFYVIPRLDLLLHSQFFLGVEG